MSALDDPESKKDVHTQSPPPSDKTMPTAPPPNEMPTPKAPASGDYQSTKMDAGVTGIRRRWKRDDLLKRGSLWLRGIAFLFSVLSFIVMACNKHDDWMDFEKYEEYRYVLAVAILSTLYTAGQSIRQVQELSTGKSIFEQRMALLIDFIGDQIMAYLLISASSSAVPLTNRMREAVDNIFTDSSAAAITMSFLAFFCLAFSALIAGYKLSTQPYI